MTRKSTRAIGRVFGVCTTIPIIYRQLKTREVLNDDDRGTEEIQFARDKTQLVLRVTLFAGMTAYYMYISSRARLCAVERDQHDEYRLRGVKGPSPGKSRVCNGDATLPPPSPPPDDFLILVRSLESRFLSDLFRGILFEPAPVPPSE